MNLVVVDTNVFINSIFGKGYFKNDEAILELEETGKLQFAFSSITFNELCKLIVNKIYEHEEFECSDILMYVVDLRRRSQFIESPTKIRPSLSSDKGDQHFIELAAHLKVSCLITNDHQNGLLKLGSYNGTSIVTSKQFMKSYNKQQKKA